jgi:Kef-type K+ transport system membrane component KefB
MVLISDLNFELPLRNPVIIFSLVLFIILFAPILFNKIRVPHVIGLILAGVIVGPYGLNLLRRDASIVLFGTVGLLYIMFMAGLEIDMVEFKKSRVKSFVFGLFTFTVPMVMGTFAAFYLLQFTFLSSILLGSMLGAHTLLAYPITSKYGISRIRSVTFSVGATIVGDIMALLVLAAVTGITKGDIGPSFWIHLAVATIIFGCIVFFVFPLIARWFFKAFDDNIAQYIFILAMVFLGSFLAEVAGLEAIIGAFISGLALNRFIPHSSALMNRIIFVGDAFFIPFFLIGVGMLVDISVLFKGLNALKVAGVMIVVAVAAKYIAAWLMQKTFSLSADERQMIFGLTNARVGATLAVVLVGYNIILKETDAGEPIRLFNEDVLNGAIIMILVTCTISSFVVEKASRKLALKEESDADPHKEDEKILISLAYPDTVTELVDFGFMLKPKKSNIPVFALHVISEESNGGDETAMGKKMMTKAVTHAASTENTIIPLTRFDMNISNGITYTIKEKNITDILIGLHRETNQKDFLGPTAEQILRRISETIFIYKPMQPFNTLKRMVVVVTPAAEFEPGFSHWFNKLSTIAKEAGMSLEYFANEATITELKNRQKEHAHPAKMIFKLFSEWEDFLIFSRELKQNDLLIIVSSRSGHISYHPMLDKLPYYLSNYFKDNSFIMLYPKQLEFSATAESLEGTDGSLVETIAGPSGVVSKAGSYLKRLFHRK